MTSEEVSWWGPSPCPPLGHAAATVWHTPNASAEGSQPRSTLCRPSVLMSFCHLIRFFCSWFHLPGYGVIFRIEPGLWDRNLAPPCTGCVASPSILVTSAAK